MRGKIHFLGRFVIAFILVLSGSFGYAQGLRENQGVRVVQPQIIDSNQSKSLLDRFKNSFEDLKSKLRQAKDQARKSREQLRDNRRKAKEAQAKAKRQQKDTRAKMKEARARQKEQQRMMETMRDSLGR